MIFGTILIFFVNPEDFVKLFTVPLMENYLQ